ncbi:MAG: conjugative transfer signal peptidase TraF [Acidobacteria bacterium]|nr:MAG: conjugative transfer signal peptidase TraF [Acidobacteriota bacterium]
MTGQLRANGEQEIRPRAGGTISLLVLAFGAGTLALALVAARAGLRLNDSPSMPTGLYVRTSSESNASLVVFCPAEPFARLSVERGYRSRGNCPDGAEPLAKPIAARAGDIVELSATGMVVNGRLLQNSPPLATDTAGRPLSHWPFGRYVVAPGTVWVASTYSPRSFDSRYFGPVEASQVREHVRPLLPAR